MMFIIWRKAAVSTAVTKTGIEFRGYGQRISLKFESAVQPLRANFDGGVGADYLASVVPLTHVPEYSSVVCRGVYPGIDWMVRATDRSLEHDWKLEAGIDARAIIMVLDDAASARVTDGGDLSVGSGELSIVWKAPLGYQEVDGVRHSVETEYVVDGRRITLGVGHYRIV